MTEHWMALGTRDFGTRVAEPTAMELLDRFVERGGSWLDTANAYMFWSDPSGVGGQSETVIGRWLAARPGMRERVRISTKVGQQPTIAGRWPESAEGLSAGAVDNAVRQSMTRLAVNRIDLLWAHAEDRSVPLGETVRALGELVASGRADRLGAANHALWRVERARTLAGGLDLPGYSAIQLRYSYLQPRPGAPLKRPQPRLVTEDVLDYVRSEPEQELWAYTPLIEGAYTRADRPLPEAYDHPGTVRRLAVLDDVAAELDATRNQVVLAWLRDGDPPIRPIVGVSRIDQLDEAMDTDMVKLTPEQRRMLDEPA